MSTPEAAPAIDERIVERFQLKAFVEACLVLEEGVAGIRDIDIGMMTGTGMIPGPFARADMRGLDEVLVALERAEDEWGDAFAPPVVLRRLVAQGRTGPAAGQGFYPYPKPEAGYEEAPVKLEWRTPDTAIFWLDNPPANSLAPAVVDALVAAWDVVEDKARTVLIASPNPTLFCAGADIKAFTSLDEAGGRALLDGAHDLFLRFERSRTMTIASSTDSRSAAAASSRWRATYASGQSASSASPRSTSASSPASPAVSGCRGSSVRRTRSR